MISAIYSIHGGATVFLLLLAALLPFILILTYESLESETWQTRRYCQITLGCYCLVLAALAI